MKALAPLRVHPTCSLNCNNHGVAIVVQGKNNLEYSRHSLSNSTLSRNAEDQEAIEIESVVISEPSGERAQAAHEGTMDRPRIAQVATLGQVAGLADFED